MTDHKRSQSLIVVLACCVFVMYVGQKATQYVQDHIEKNSIVYGENLQSVSAVNNAKLSNLYPVSVQTTKFGQRKSEVDLDFSIEKAFQEPPSARPISKRPVAPKKVIIKKKEVQPEPDLLNLQIVFLQVDGVANNGVFLCGKYVKIGDGLRDVLPSLPEKYCPVLESITDKSIVVRDTASNKFYTIEYCSTEI